MLKFGLFIERRKVKRLVLLQLNIKQQNVAKQLATISAVVKCSYPVGFLVNAEHVFVRRIWGRGLVG